jgi:hypothetical protein
MSKINSLALVMMIAISLSSCTDKSKSLLTTWRVENVKFNKPIPPQMQTYIQSQIDFMKANQRTTYNADGTFDDVQGPKNSKGHWDLSKDAKVVYSTDETGKTVRYMISELTKDKFTYSLVPAGPNDTLTFFLVPFAAKDTLNRKPMPQMQPQAQQQENAPAEQPADSSAPATKGSK